MSPAMNEVYHLMETYLEEEKKAHTSGTLQRCQTAIVMLYNPLLRTQLFSIYH
jgi:hypothetical protein